MALATKEKYGFEDFKLKGRRSCRKRRDGCDPCNEESTSRTQESTLIQTVDGCLEEAVEYVKGMEGILTYCEDPCGAEGVYSGREIMSEFRSRTGYPDSNKHDRYRLETGWTLSGISGS